MAQPQIPIVFREVMNLPQLGLQGDQVKFGTTSMESDKFITVCETVNGAAQVVIIDMTAGNSVTRRPISAEAAIMNPVSKVIALRAGAQLQIFNLELRAKMKQHQMTETVSFWRWISPNMIGIVTPTAVFHWSIEGESAPTKICDRHATLGEGTQIISYKTSADNKWSLLIGICQGAGGIQGNMQLYSHEKQVSQVLQGHSGAFTTIAVPGRADRAQVLCFAEKKPDTPPRLFVMEVGRSKDLPGEIFRLQPQQIPFPPEAAADFPVCMQASSKQDIIYMITKFGFLYLFDIHTGAAIFRTRISQDTVFVTTDHSASGGILGITARTGQVFQIGLNDGALVPYIVNTLRNNALAIALSARLGLPGADELYVAEFNRLVAANDVQGAARLAASSPQGVLRTPATIQRFQSMAAVPGQPQPVLQYFSVLLEKGKLNRLESLELARPVLAQGRGQLLEKWLTEDKLECSEELGDLLLPADSNMALSVYLRANVPEKVINCFVQRGEFDKIVAYAAKVNYHCDWTFMLQNLVRVNPNAAKDFATKLATNESGPLIDINSAIDIFMQMNRIQEVTGFLLEALKNNRQSEGYLQTRLLEINLLGGTPQVADAILQNAIFSHYDRLRVAQLCEKAGLGQRAMEHYTELSDIKRTLARSAQMNPEWLITFFGSLTSENSLECLRELLNTNIRQNLNLVVQIATKYSEQLTPAALIALFERFTSYEGLYYYLGAIVNFSQEPLVHFKYIHAAGKMGQFKEVERVCRDSTVYEPVAVKEMLKELKLADPRPLIHVCDRYDFVEEMTQYLYSNNLLKYIEVYATKVSPQKTHMVVGKLLDLDCNEDFIRGLLNAVGQLCPVDLLVEQVERRNRLRLLQPFLEARVQQGNTEPATHNAIGKIYISLNRDPQSFLANNQFYDSAVVGKFCEKLDPSLAFIAYRRAGGACDEDLIRVCTENGLYKDLARYLVEKQDLELWAKVLTLEEGAEESPQRRAVIDQVVQTALPESNNPDEVSLTVRAFMQADLPSELMELLERIVLQGSDFAENRNLQNLLILTAIRADSGRVMDYINRLDNFDGPEIAKIAVGEQYNLHEEAFVIYKKFDNNVEAIEVLLDYLEALDRAYEFADRCNQPEVWSKLGKAQLDNNMVAEAVASYIKADDAERHNEVIDAAERGGQYEPLVEYLRMARRHVKESHLDTELVYALAKVNKLPELEEFVSSPNVADIQNIGERLFEEGLYEAAKILFANVNNNAKLALCHVRLGQFREAVEAASKANAVGTWKEINIACVTAGEFRLATMCGLHIIVHPDHLEELILHYERRGHPDELIKLMEQGLGLESAHAGVFTELGVLYSKYNPAKLMEHIKIFHSRMNVPKLLRACERGEHWQEATFLYKEGGQYDNAVRTMTEHPSAFVHDLFLDCVQKVRNQEVHYKAISFYLEQHPLQLVRMLQVLTPNLDHARVVHMLKKADQLPLVLPYLKDVQKENLAAVNEAINEVLVLDEQYEALRHSVDDHDNFDQIALAQRLEKHELLEFRRVAAYLFKKNRRWAQSVKLSKDDKMYKDAIDTAAQSEDAELAEELLRFFVGIHDKECFAATLFTCYALISPDTAMELAWRNNYVDFVMPYMIQYVRHLHTRVNAIDTRTQPQAEQPAIPEEVVNMDQGGYMYQPTGMLQIANVAYNQDMGQSYMGGDMGQGYGMGYGMQQSMGMGYGGMM